MGEKQRPGIMLYFDQYAPVSGFSYESIGRLLDACMRYAQTGEEPELSGELAVAWGFWRPLIDRDAETYRRKCARASRAAQARWEAREEAGISKEPESLTGFEQKRRDAIAAMRDFSKR